MLVAPRNQENQTDAGANRAIGDIERGKSDFISVAAQLHVKTDEVHDFMAEQSVEKISRDAAENQAERNLADKRVRIEMVSREKKRDKRKQTDKRKRAVVAAEQTPRRAGVAPMHEFEKAGNNNSLFVSAERFEHEMLGKLIEHKNYEREQRDAAIGISENGFGGDHAVQSPKSKVQSQFIVRAFSTLDFGLSPLDFDYGAGADTR